MATAARTSHNTLPHVSRHAAAMQVPLHITRAQQHGRRVDDHKARLMDHCAQPPCHGPVTLSVQKSHLGGLTLKPQLLAMRISGENNCSRLLVIPKPGHCGSD